MADQTPHIEPRFSASGSLAQEYFDRLYSERADPWDFTTSAYEAEKYEATLAALPRSRYLSALELGCSIGVLTRLLASRCDRLLATDICKAALDSARKRCRDLAHVRTEQRDVSWSFPRGPFDLIVVSEVAYYLSLPDLAKLRRRIADELAPQGHLILVHYTGPTNYPLTALQVHQAFREWEGKAWSLVAAGPSKFYRLDLFESLDP
jgi:predicted TPR repeat methyltransferase